MSGYEEVWFEDEEEEYDDEEVCPEGYHRDECCGCVFRRGVESCEFCPFGKLPRHSNCRRWRDGR